MLQNPNYERVEEYQINKQTTADLTSLLHGKNNIRRKKYTTRSTTLTSTFKHSLFFVGTFVLFHVSIDTGYVFQ